MVGIITPPAQDKRFHVGYTLTVMVDGKATTATKETTTNAATIRGAIACVKQEIFIKMKRQKPLIKINFCVEVKEWKLDLLK